MTDKKLIIKNILNLKTIAVVGMSPRLERPSNYVSEYMIKQGYSIIPVNPGHSKINSMKSFKSILDIPDLIDIVNVFRQPQYVLPIVKNAISINAKVLWLQEGVQNEEAEQLAKDSNLIVISNDCIMRCHQTIKKLL